jgi:TRAP-type C4-dicarboxylate transport system substrate-binding protein
MIKPGFYRGGLTLLVNPNSWDRLSGDQQQRIKDYKANVWNSSPDGGLWFLSYNNEQTKMIEENGVQVIELSSEDARTFLKKAYDSAWADIIEKAPERGPQFRKLLVNEDLLPQ